MGEFFAFLKHFRVLTVFLVLEFIAIILLLKFNTYQHSIFFNVSNSIRTNLFSSLDIVQDYFSLEKQNSDLRVENAFLLEKIEYQEQIQELKIPENLKRYDCIPAKVLHSSVRFPDNYLIIDKGEDDGIETETSVVTTEGIVGVVYATSSNYATVLPAINTSFSCVASVGDYTLSANTFWDGRDYRYISVENVPLHVKVQKGDTVFTNNNSMLYPNRMTIGTVDDVSTVDLGKSNQLKVKLEVDFSRLRNVYILRNNHKSEIDSLLANE